MSSRPTAVAAALLIALGPIACGGSDEGDYKEEFPAVSQKIGSLGDEVGESIETAGESTDRELAAEFEGFAEELGDIRQELDELEPPDDLAAQQDELVAAVGEVQSSLEDIAAAADNSDPDAARRAAEELVQRSADLREARRTLAQSVREL